MPEVEKLIERLASQIGTLSASNTWLELQLEEARAEATQIKLDLVNKESERLTLLHERDRLAQELNDLLPPPVEGRDA